MIRQNQIEGLLAASKHNLVAGLLVNFRNKNNDTFFILIDEFIEMMSSIQKKSFNVQDLQKYRITKINSAKKRTRYIYDISNMINELHLKLKGDKLKNEQFKRIFDLQKK